MPTLQQRQEATARVLQKAWVQRRPAWTRNDTMRWLNDRSASVLAWLRRIDAAGAPAHSNSMGRWLQQERSDLFSRAHKRLASCGRDDGARAKLNVWGTLT
jgi:hypothetical protein